MLLLSRHWRYHAEYSASQKENNPQFLLESKKGKTNFKKGHRASSPLLLPKPPLSLLSKVLFHSKVTIVKELQLNCGNCKNVELWIAKISAFWLHQSQVPLERPALMTRIWWHLHKSNNCIWKNVKNSILRNLTIVFFRFHRPWVFPPASYINIPAAPQKSPQKDPEKTPKLPWPCSATGLPLYWPTWAVWRPTCAIVTTPRLLL